MSKAQLENKTQVVTFVEMNTGVITVKHWADKTSNDKDIYYLHYSDATYQKLESYKSISALMKYVKANQIQRDFVTICSRPPETSINEVDGGILLEADTPAASSSCPSVAKAPYSDGNAGASLFCDTETTGLGRNSEVVEIALVDINENIVFQSLVKPSKPISKEAIAVHGITNAMVANAPTFADIWDKFQSLVKNKDIYFYNEVFDLQAIKNSVCKAFGYPHATIKFNDLFKAPLLKPPKVHCLMEEYASYWGEWSDYHQSYRWQKLVNACHQQRIPIHDIPNHRAAGDAIKTARLYKHLLKQGALVA